jgi:hypothetical protein
MRTKNSDMRSIEDRLRAERPAHQAPESLTDRVMADLPSESPSAPHPVSSFWRFSLGFATVCLLTVMSLHFIRQNPGPPSAPRQAVAAAPVEPLNFALPQIQAVPIENLTMHLDQPLERELQNVISDARLAIQFVASSFLPEK